MRKFNTEGPVVAADHYRIPPLERVNLAEVLGLVRDCQRRSENVRRRPV